MHQSSPQPLADKIRAVVSATEPELGDIALLSGSRLITARPAVFSPCVSIAVHLRAGSRFESASEHGLTHFFEHLPAASWRSDRGETLLEFTNRKLWTPRIHIDCDLLTFGFICPDYDAAEAIDVLSTMLNRDLAELEPAFEVEQRRIINEIEGAAADPVRQKLGFVGQRFFPGTGYDHPTAGSLADIYQYTFNDVAAKGMQVLSNANAIFAVSGPVEVIELARRRFDGLVLPGNIESPRTKLSDKLDWRSIPGASSHITDLVPNIDIEAYLPGITHGSRADRLAHNILALTLDGRIAHMLSHSSGMSYAAGVQSFSVGDVQLLRANANVAPNLTWTAGAMIKRELERLPKLLGPELLDAVRERLRAELYTASSQHLFADVLAVIATDQPVTTPRERLHDLEHMTTDHLRSIAAQHFDPHSLKFVFHGSEKIIGAI